MSRLRLAGQVVAPLEQDPDFFQIEVALEIVEHLVLDLALAVEPQKLGPAGGDRRPSIEVEMRADAVHEIVGVGGIALGTTARLR